MNRIRISGYALVNNSKMAAIDLLIAIAVKILGEDETMLILKRHGVLYTKEKENSDER